MEIKLSNESRSYISNLKNGAAVEGDNTDLRLNKARLFCELYGIINQATAVLSKSSMGRWSVCYQGENAEGTGFDFRLQQSKKDLYPHVMIRIALNGNSSIEVLSRPNGASMAEKNIEVTRFLRSTAYKRYFEPYSFGPYDLKAVIPSRQILSRDFGQYLVHLLEMMIPYLMEISISKESARKAA